MGMCLSRAHIHSLKRTGKSKALEWGQYQLQFVLAGGYKSVLPEKWVVRRIEEGRVDQLHGAIERMLRIPPCTSELLRGSWHSSLLSDLG